MILCTALAASITFSTCDMQAIVNNKPSIKTEDAIKISKAIRKNSDKYKIPFNIMAAIARVESSYNIDAINKRTADYGLFQINEYNIKAYGFDREKLLNDIDYSTGAGFKVFEWFYKRYPAEEAIKRYNCGTRKGCVDLPIVDDYLKKVKQYL